MISLTQCGLVTKVRAKEGRLLKVEDYTALAEKRSVEEVCVYLKQCEAYGLSLAGVSEGTVERGELERILAGTLYKEYNSLRKFMSGFINEVRFLNQYMEKHESQHIKIMLRLFNVGKYEAALGYMPESMEGIAKLREARNLTSFLEAVKDTKYYKILSPIDFGDTRDGLFRMEMALDMAYFSELWKHAQNTRMREVFGMEMDILNILWIQRCRVYYTLNKEMTYSFLIPYTYKLKKEEIRNMVEDKEMVIPPRYRPLFVGEKDLLQEDNYRRFIYKLHRRNIRQGSDGIGTALSYLQLKKSEIERLTSIIEGVRYGMDPQVIRRFVY